MVSGRRRRRWEEWLTMAIRRVAILSTVLHLMRMILTSSTMSMGEGSEHGIPSTVPSLEDIPMVGPTARTRGREQYPNNPDTGNDTLVLPQQQQSSSSTLALDVHAPTRVRRIPLEELLQSQSNMTCDPGTSGRRLILPSSTHPNDSSSSSSLLSSRRRIPPMVHVTSKTRCMTPAFLDNLDKWRFPGYGFHVHDEEAMDRLLTKYWPEFPHLQWIQQHCMISGAAKADLWRLLVLWEYGGIYTDIDNAPGKDFQNGTAIQGTSQDDSCGRYFVSSFFSTNVLNVGYFACFVMLSRR